MREIIEFYRMSISTFITHFPPTQVDPVDPEVIAKFQSVLPDYLISLWKEHGFGKYGDGLLELVNPDDFQSPLGTWLAKNPPNYFPIATSAFGHLFYYRKLSEQDEDVCMVDPLYVNIVTCVWSLEEFFEGYLCDDEVQQMILRKPLFNQGIAKLGPLARHEIFLFQPALAAGGAEKVEYLGLGNCQVHLEILFQFR